MLFRYSKKINNFNKYNIIKEWWKMKKIIALFLIGAICISFCSCGGAGDSDGDKRPKEIVLKQTELAQYCEYTELTTENWKEFFEIKTEEITNTDAFGEETDTDTWLDLYLKDDYYISEDNALRLSYKWTNYNREFTDFTDDYVFDASGRRRNLWCVPESDVTCVKIKGTVLKLTVPEDKWSIDEEGNKYLAVNYIQDDSYVVKRVNHERVVYEEFISQD